MAEQIDSSSPSPETDDASTLSNTARRDRTRRASAPRPEVKTPAAKNFSGTSFSAKALVQRSAALVALPRKRAGAPRVHPVRSFVTIAAVAGMVATVAIPAFVAADRGESAEAMTVQQVAAEDPQNLVVASEATPEALDRGGYSATTPEEIQAKKDAEAKAAAEAAAQAALAARLSSNAASASAYSAAIPATIAASGSVVRPLPYFDNFGTPYAGHKGTDYMVGRGTPLYAMADGVVIASTESGPGWGVYVQIQHNIGGQNVTSLYAHMLYGSRRVQVGQSVSAGQLIGQVSDTGRAFGTHLHLEIRVNGGYVNAESWLQANAI